MKHKLVIVVMFSVLLSALAGVVSPSIEQWWRDRSADPGQLKAKHISELYQADQFHRAFDEATRAKDERKFATYRPQILYIQWLAARQLGHAGAKAAGAEFLATYPSHPLGADIRFAQAMAVVVDGDYTGADEILAEMQIKYPNAKIADRVREMRGKVSSAIALRARAQAANP